MAKNIKSALPVRIIIIERKINMDANHMKNQSSEGENSTTLI